MHKFVGGDCGQAFQMQEMGTTGTGSLEHGDASGEIFWVKYPFPFLTFYYATFVGEKPGDKEHRSPMVVALDEESSNTVEGNHEHDTMPEFPNLRLSKAPVMQFFAINSDRGPVEAGPKSGQFAAEFECLIEGSDNCPCGKKRVIYHKAKRSVSTSNLITGAARAIAANDANHMNVITRIMNVITRASIDS